MKPSGLDKQNVETPFADPSSLSALLQKADNMARERPRIPMPEHSTASMQPQAPTPSPEQSEKIAPDVRFVTKSELAASENRIEALLKDFEEAASNARTSQPHAPKDDTATPSYKIVDREEDLPVIQVYRKSEIEIFKRNQHGVLEPAGKTSSGGR